TNEKRGRAKSPSMSMIRKRGDRFSERSCSTKILERQRCWRSRWVSPPAPTGDKQRRRGRPYWSRTRRRTPRLGIAERQRDEAHAVALLHAQQHLMLALRLGIDQRLAHVADIGDRLAADVEDDGAGLKTLLGGEAVRIDRGDDDALGAGAGHFAGRSHRQAEMRHAAGRLRAIGIRLGLLLV